MIVAYIDGGARGNPGPAGYGVRIEDETGALIEEFNGFLGSDTSVSVPSVCTTARNSSLVMMLLPGS